MKTYAEVIKLLIFIVFGLEYIVIVSKAIQTYYMNECDNIPYVKMEDRF